MSPTRNLLAICLLRTNSLHIRFTIAVQKNPSQMTI